MGSAKNAYLHFLGRSGGTFDEGRLDPNDLSLFARMAGIAAGNKQSPGALRYDMYPKDVDTSEFKNTVGRLGPGGATREEATYRIRDPYDFNSQGLEFRKQAELAGKALSQGDVVSALGQVSPNLGKNFQTDIRIPVPLNELGYKPAYDPENTVFGGQRYRWSMKKVPEGGVEELARTAFSNNKYKPEGSNLQNYMRMIYAQNKGNSSQYFWTPEAVVPEKKKTSLFGF